MGILSAMNKSVSGLNAQSFALENISGNIANSQTTAYKRTDTSFQDMIQGSSNKPANMTSGSVRATARSTLTSQGGIESSGNATYMGVKGAGYFVVREKSGEVDGSSVFNATPLYSRRGDFQLDREGFLVNGAGHYLTGLAIDQSTGNAIGDTPEVIQIGNDEFPAAATTVIDYKLNLPKVPTTETWDAAPEGDDLLAENNTAFVENTISGQTVTIYDATGQPLNVQFRWAKLTTGEGENTQWQVYYKSDSDAADGEQMWTGIDQVYEFDADGQMVEPAEGQVDLTDIVVDGSTFPTMRIQHGTSGITQYADENGAARVRQLTQDGVPSGSFVDVSISDGGRITANYSNGKTLDIYQIPLRSFAGESWLRAVDGGAYMETKESGPPISDATGSIVGSALESSNVDIGEEFTKLIVTQQAFSANSRVISTADQMMSDVLNIIR
ncbi:flagellar hook protein FlgE [Mongoliimonas terrestris]|uniref:flagellar hook protein FlgE n=1 Tax=Mongoliimonas terrestris TaxID=1709001 RepID=UPI000949A459|nr:flagellar hook protein FlgE [Mongoliimonas terrestris]